MKLEEALAVSGKIGVTKELEAKGRNFKEGAKKGVAWESFLCWPELPEHPVTPSAPSLLPN